MLNEKQRKAVNAIMNSVEGKGKQRCFFIDGPGGTGKTFIYRTLYYLLQGRQKRIRNMATTGIAATLLPEGMTAHKTFALDVPLRPDSVSRISSGTIKGNVLAATDVFFLDEAPMMPKYGIENMDDKLRELKKRKHIPFGGAVMVFGGDFRQCLPVQTRANSTELRDLSIKKSKLWKEFEVFKLSDNMRVNQKEGEAFKQWLLKVF